MDDLKLNDLANPNANRTNPALMVEISRSISKLSVDLSSAIEINTIAAGEWDWSPRAYAKKSCQLDLSQLHKNQRQTGRITEVFDLEIQMKTKKTVTNYICCCIIPYIDEEPTVYFPGYDMLHPTDIYQHDVELKYERIFFNICSKFEVKSVSILQRATDGALILTHNKSLNEYKLMKTEKCTHRHHDLRRYSTMGRLLTYLCTGQGLLSTAEKCCHSFWWCWYDMDSWQDYVAVETLQCERKLYRQRTLLPTVPQLHVGTSASQ